MVEFIRRSYLDTFGQELTVGDDVIIQAAKSALGTTGEPSEIEVMGALPEVLEALYNRASSTEATVAPEDNGYKLGGFAKGDIGRMARDNANIIRQHYREKYGDDHRITDADIEAVFTAVMGDVTDAAGMGRVINERMPLILSELKKRLGAKPLVSGEFGAALHDALKDAFPATTTSADGISAAVDKQIFVASLKCLLEQDMKPAMRSALETALKRGESAEVIPENYWDDVGLTGVRRYCNLSASDKAAVEQAYKDTGAASIPDGLVSITVDDVLEQLDKRAGLQHFVAFVSKKIDGQMFAQERDDYIGMRAKAKDLGYVPDHFWVTVGTNPPAKFKDLSDREFGLRIVTELFPRNL